MYRWLNVMLGALGLLVICCAHFVLSEHLSTPVTDVVSQQTTPSAATALRDNHDVAITSEPSVETAVPPLPATLSGLSHEVTLQVDTQGHLVTRIDTLRLMDFYLAAVDDEPLPVIRQRIENDIRLQLAGHRQALAEGLALLERYWSYRSALDWLPPLEDGASAWALGQQFEHINALRQQYFTDQEREIFFGEEEAQDRFMLQTLAIQQDPNTSVETKQLAIDALQASQSESFREKRNEVTRISDVQARAHELKQSGADQASIHRVRAEALGEQAAQALAELDEKQAAWSRKLDAFSARYDQILASDQSAESKQRSVDALLESQFDATERQHAMAYVEIR